MITIKLKIFILLTILIGSTLLVADLGFANTADTVLDGFGDTGDRAGYPVDSSGKPKNEFTKAFPIYFTGLASVISGVAVILFLYAGWLWMTAQGNDEQIARAKKIMIGAIIGLTIIIFARLISELAFSILETGYNKTQS